MAHAYATGKPAEGKKWEPSPQVPKPVPEAMNWLDRGLLILAGIMLLWGMLADTGHGHCAPNNHATEQWCVERGK